MSSEKFVSLLPADATQGGLALDAADVILKQLRFVMWNYNGSQADGPALHVVMIDGEDKQHDQYYSAGKAERCVPSEDGKKLLPVAENATGLNKSTKAFAFLVSLVNAEPKVNDLLVAGDVTVLDGTRAHVIAVPDKDKDGNVTKNAKGYDRTTILVSKVYALPGEKVKAAGAKTPAAGKPAAAKPTPATPAAEVSDELAAEAASLLLGIVSEAGGTVARAKVSALMFQAANKAKSPNKSALTSLVFKEDFLTSRPEFTYADGNISIAA